MQWKLNWRKFKTGLEMRWPIYRVVQKRIPSFNFWDNFGNSAPTLTTLYCYKQKFMARNRKVLPPTTPLLCDHIT